MSEISSINKFVILHNTSKLQPVHGYEIVKTLKETGLATKASSGGVYRILRELEKDALIASYWDLSSEGGPPSRKYEVTQSGKSYLNHLGGKMYLFASTLRFYAKDYALEDTSGD